MPVVMPKTLKNMNLKVLGQQQAGRILELNPPAINFTYLKAKAGRLIPVPVPIGFASDFKFSFTMAEYSTLLHSLVGSDTPVLYTALGSLNDDESPSTTPVRIDMTGYLSYSPSKWSAGSGTKDKYDLVCLTCNYTGTSMIMMDANSHIYMVNGVDIIDSIKNKIAI